MYSLIKTLTILVLFLGSWNYSMAMFELPDTYDNQKIFLLVSNALKLEKTSLPRIYSVLTFISGILEDRFGHRSTPFDFINSIPIEKKYGQEGYARNQAETATYIKIAQNLVNVLKAQESLAQPLIRCSVIAALRRSSNYNKDLDIHLMQSIFKRIFYDADNSKEFFKILEKTIPGIEFTRLPSIETVGDLLRSVRRYGVRYPYYDTATYVFTGFYSGRSLPSFSEDFFSDFETMASQFVKSFNSDDKASKYPLEQNPKVIDFIDKVNARFIMHMNHSVNVIYPRSQEEREKREKFIVTLSHGAKSVCEELLLEIKARRY